MLTAGSPQTYFLSLVCCSCLDRYPPRRQLFDAPIGHKVLQLQSAPANETEGRTHGSRTIHVSLPQDAQGVGVIIGDASFVTVEADPQSRRHGSRVKVRQVAVAAAVGVHRPLAVAVPLALTVTMSLRKQDLAHAHCEEAEGRRILAFLCPAVMAAVWVTPGGRQKKCVQGKNKEGISRFFYKSQKKMNSTLQTQSIKHKTTTCFTLC